MKKKQEQFLKAFDEAACNIAVACKKADITRQTFYNWKNECKEFADAVEDCQESLLDFAETKLHQNIMEGKEASIFFFLKTKGKDRGYVERVENDVRTNAFEELMKDLESKEER